MAKNTGKDFRIGSVDNRSQVYNPKTQQWVKRDDGDGRLTGGNGNGNRLNRCVGSPGQDIFGGLLLKRIFGS